MIVAAMVQTLGLNTVVNPVSGAISQIALAMPSSGQTSLSSAATGVPNGNQVTVTNPPASMVAVRYTV